MISSPLAKDKRYVGTPSFVSAKWSCSPPLGELIVCAKALQLEAKSRAPAAIQCFASFIYS